MRDCPSAHAIRSVTSSLPVTGRSPDQPPVAVHDSTLAAYHASCTSPPKSTEDGLAPSSSQATPSGAPTAIATAAVASPASPLQVSVNSLLTESGSCISVPESEREPDQAPDAAQVSTFEDDHDSVGVPRNDGHAS